MEMNIQDPIYADSMRFGEALIMLVQKALMELAHLLLQNRME